MQYFIANQSRIFKKIQRSLVFSSIIITFPAMAGVSTGTDVSAKLPYWQINSSGLYLRLIQRLPDQTRAFFAARGFTPSNVEKIARSCIFQTIVRNSLEEQTTEVSYDLNTWIIKRKTQETRLKTREHWRREWLKANVSQAARIAFEWALLPTKQQYQPQDNNWGMTSFNLPPGTRFDLVVEWRYGDILKSLTISDVECAADLHLEPKDLEK